MQPSLPAKFLLGRLPPQGRVAELLTEGVRRMALFMSLLVIVLARVLVLVQMICLMELGLAGLGAWWEGGRECD